MPVDMIEQENQGTSLDSLGARAEVVIATIGDLDRTFLIKRMEIEFIANGGVDVVGSQAFATGNALLVFYHDSGVSADAEAALDAGLTDKESHNDIIWSRPFLISPKNLDDAGGWFLPGIDTVFKTSKSFPKGYPLDKDDTYQWKVLNLSESLAFPNPVAEGSTIMIRTRFWGVYL